MSELDEKKELVARLRALAERALIDQRASYASAEKLMETAEELDRKINEATERG